MNHDVCRNVRVRTRAMIQNEHITMAWLGIGSGNGLQRISCHFSRSRVQLPGSVGAVGYYEQLREKKRKTLGNKANLFERLWRRRASPSGAKLTVLDYGRQSPDGLRLTHLYPSSANLDHEQWDE